LKLKRTWNVKKKKDTGCRMQDKKTEEKNEPQRRGERGEKTDAGCKKKRVTCYVKCVTKGKNKAKDVPFSSLLLLSPLLRLPFPDLPCSSPIFSVFHASLLPRCRNAIHRDG